MLCHAKMGSLEKDEAEVMGGSGLHGEATALAGAAAVALADSDDDDADHAAATGKVGASNG